MEKRCKLLKKQALAPTTLAGQPCDGDLFELHIRDNWK